MSTKIYNGYRIMGSSLDEVITRLFSNKEKLTQLIEDKIHEDILSRVISSYHDLCFSSFMEKEASQQNSSAFGKVINEAMKEEEKFELKEHNTVDVSICFFPQKQEFNNESYYLLMLFAGQEKNMIVNSEVWKTLNIEEFAYWDNTDPPETVTDYEWEARDKQWNSVLTGLSPAQSSMIIELKKEYKFNCMYFRDQKDLTKIFEKHFTKVLEQRKSKIKNLMDYYEESFKDKVAFKACSPGFLENKKLEELTKEEQQQLYSKVREYSRQNLFTQEEQQTIDTNLKKIKKIISMPFEFNDLFEKKEVIQEKTKNLFKTNKIKM